MEKGRQNILAGVRVERICERSSVLPGIILQLRYSKFVRNVTILQNKVQNANPEVQLKAVI